jgi:hypothetical protein
MMPNRIKLRCHFQFHAHSGCLDLNVGPLNPLLLIEKIRVKSALQPLKMLFFCEDFSSSASPSAPLRLCVKISFGFGYAELG